MKERGGGGGEAVEPDGLTKGLKLENTIYMVLMTSFGPVVLIRNLIETLRKQHKFSQNIWIMDLT